MTENKTVEEIEVPQNVFVPCPQGGAWANVNVMRECVERCEHFQGLYALGIAGSHQKVAAMKFVDRYRVKCSHPVSREMLEVKL